MAHVAWRRVRWQIAARGAAVRHGGAREAVIVELHGDDGAVGLGEAAPLPGMSAETLDDVVAELATYDGGAVRSPSLAFALEAAARRGDVGNVRSAVVVDDAAQAGAAHAPALKLKVGRADDAARVASIAAAAPGVPLRLDANRAWPAREAADRIAALAAVVPANTIAWIEEPCVDAVGLVARPLAAPIALDESLASLADADIVRAVATGRVAALVLKPTVLGPARCRALAALARTHGVAAIVSHALEGPIAHAACVALAAELGGDVPHGVAPHAGLDDWALSITAASSPAPAVITATTTLSFAAVARATRTASHATSIVAAPALATLHAIHGALDAHRPLALHHHRLAPAELDRQRAAVAAASVPADTAFVLFTSGSTGTPRGVVLPRATVAAAAAAGAAHLPWRDDDRWLLALSLAHAGGLAILVRCLVARRPVVLLDGDFDPQRCAALLGQATLASLVPTQLAALLDDPAWLPPPSLRAVLLGGAAAPPALIEVALARGVPMLATYGATETFGQVATARVPGGPLVALPGIAIGTDADRLVVRGPTLAARYLDGEPIAPAFVTADLGAYDAATGTLTVHGRRDDVIISGGENVHPAEIEAVLAATPGVRAAIAFGITDARWGQRVAAAIAVDRRFDRTAAAAHWYAALPAHARPRRLAIAAALPVGPTGKLDRRAAAALPATDVCYGA